MKWDFLEYSVCGLQGDGFGVVGKIVVRWRLMEEIFDHLFHHELLTLVYFGAICLTYSEVGRIHAFYGHDGIVLIQICYSY